MSDVVMRAVGGRCATLFEAGAAHLFGRGGCGEVAGVLQDAVLAGASADGAGTPVQPSCRTACQPRRRPWEATYRAYRTDLAAVVPEVSTPFADDIYNVTATATGTTPNVAYTYSAYGAVTSTTGSLVQP